MDFFDFLQLIGGLTFFLFGMQIMSGSLAKMAGGKLERRLKKMTESPLISVSLGAIITIAMQSSSAVTVMLVGLVNSGIMQFLQTINVIFGANIGTTLTSWILSLSGIESENIWIQMLKPENFSPIIAFVGILMSMASKDDKKKSIGTVFVGFSILMYGMEFMSGSVKGLSEIPQFSQILVKFNNPIFGVLVGLVITAVIQSSAASIGILQALSLTGGISYGMAIPIVMGQNIGTCITSMISCIGTNANAKRVATIHTLINVFGTVICLTIFCIANYAFKVALLDTAASPISIAIAHTAFNLITTAFLMPFSKYIGMVAEKLIPNHTEQKSITEKNLYIDERLFLSPSVAIAECNSLTKKMAVLARENLYLAMNMFDAYDDKIAVQIKDNEEELDMYEDKLGTYLVKISKQAISVNDARIISKMLHAIGDFERLGDHALNLLSAAEEMRDKKAVFSNDAVSELRVLTNAIDEILMIATTAYEKNDLEMAVKVEPLEQIIDKLTAEIKTNHINRLQSGECTIELGFMLSDILNDYERISDHCSNIAVTVIETEHDSYDVHQYLNGVKYGNVEFNEIYDRYSKKYYI